jgi:hypothetical protein
LTALAPIAATRFICSPFGAGDRGKAERGICRILAKMAFRLIKLPQLEKYKKIGQCRQLLPLLRGSLFEGIHGMVSKKQRQSLARMGLRQSHAEDQRHTLVASIASGSFF